MNATSTFNAVDLNHIALNVRDVQRSRRWYEKHLGLRLVHDGGEQSCFLTTGRGWLALFRSDTPGLNHYCFALDKYDPDEAMKTLEGAGLSPRHHGNRVYFDDPEGIECQLAQAGYTGRNDKPVGQHDASESGGAGEVRGGTFRAVDLNHIALRVRDVERSQAWYENHLGLKPMGQRGFITTGRGWLALFQGDTPGLDHYCYSIDKYDPDGAMKTLEAAGLKPKRRGNRVYFDDPDGIECQIAQTNSA